MSDGSWIYTWKNGRQLATMQSKFNGTTWTYTYDANGMRTKRTNGTITVRNSYNPEGARIAKIVNRSNGSETHRYTYNGGKLVYDIIRINKEGTISNLTILMSYDESGRPFMITYANVSYYYLLNAQGDVVGIINVSGDIMVEYTYDAWGNVLSITGPMADTMGQHNQLRYRGYVYDPETELYFLNSRFYNPEKGRFINADAYISTGQGLIGNNMLTYCGNNPVMRCDPNGRSFAAVCYSDKDPFTAMCLGISLRGGSSTGSAVASMGFILLLYKLADIADNESPILSDEAENSYIPQPPKNNRDDDDDDDYYDDENNFARREKVGKGNGNRPGNNQAQNKQFKDATKHLSKSQKRMVHNEITGKGYGYHDIVAISKDMIVFFMVCFDLDED